MSSASRVIGVVGAGVMGSGIAQLFAAGGHRVLLVDARQGAAEAARQQIGQMLDKLAAKGVLADAGAAKARLSAVPRLEHLSGTDLVIEAIVEDLGAKQELLRDLEAIVGRRTVLASNTSSLSITSLATACRQPERMVGLHFFNPVPLMRLVEIVPGLRTAPDLVEDLSALVAGLGHTGVVVADRPGFLVNHIGRGYTGEALRIWGEAIAPPATIDAVLKDCLGFRMGPFELLDLTGLDVSAAVMRQVYDGYWQEPRFRPVPDIAARVAAGLHGRKTGAGFYAYPLTPAPAAPAPAATTAPIWIAPGPFADEVAALVRRLGGRVDTSAAPAGEAIALFAPLGSDCTTAAVAAGVDPARAVAIDALAGLDRHRVLMAPPGQDPAVLAGVAGLLGSDGVPVSRIGDGAGFIVQRVVAMMVLIACDAAQQRLATPAAIDGAATLGLGYPLGPFALATRLGAARIHQIAERLFAATGDARFRPSVWLSRRVALSMPIDLGDSSPCDLSSLAGH